MVSIHHPSQRAIPFTMCIWVLNGRQSDLPHSWTLGSATWSALANGMSADTRASRPRSAGKQPTWTWALRRSAESYHWPLAGSRHSHGAKVTVACLRGSVVVCYWHRVVIDNLYKTFTKSCWKPLMSSCLLLVNVTSTFLLPPASHPWVSDFLRPHPTF